VNDRLVILRSPVRGRKGFPVLDTPHLQSEGPVFLVFRCEPNGPLRVYGHGDGECPIRVLNELLMDYPDTIEVHFVPLDINRAFLVAQKQQVVGFGGDVNVSEAEELSSEYWNGFGGVREEPEDGFHRTGEKGLRSSEQQNSTSDGEPGTEDNYLTINRVKSYIYSSTKSGFVGEPRSEEPCSFPEKEQPETGSEAEPKSESSIGRITEAEGGEPDYSELAKHYEEAVSSPPKSKKTRGKTN